MGKRRSRKGAPLSVIRRLREARNTSREELADEIKVTAEAIAQWEEGTVQPTLVQFRNLAYAFGCSAKDLQNRQLGDGPKILTNTYFISTDREIEDGWWGHFGVRLPGHSQSKWYPITLGTANSISRTLRNCDGEDEWLLVRTLNNRLLVINPIRTSRLWLLDDAQDEPDEDWSIPIDGYSGQPAEFYKVLEEYVDGAESESMDTVTQAIEAFTDALDLGHEELYGLIYETHVHDRNGRCTSYWVNESNLVEAVEMMELGSPPYIFNLSCDNFDSYFPAQSIAMIDMPHMLVLNAMERAEPASAEEGEE